MPFISVILPAYNAEKLLSTAVKSVLEQTLADLELIIIDDGSTDGTAALCDSFAEQDARVKVVHKENGGVSEARNTGLKMAAGKKIAFIDADDSYMPETLAVLRELTEGGALAAACADTLTYDDQPEQYEAPPCPAGTYSAEEAKKLIVIPLLSDRLSPQPLNGYIWRFLFDRNVIERSHLRFNGAYLEDEVFLAEYFCCGSSLAVTDKPLYRYYQNMQSVTKRYLKNYLSTFRTSLSAKDALVRDYSLELPPAWRDNTCWAGLLIAVSNELAPGNVKSSSEKTTAVKALCAEPEFAHAISSYVPSELSGNRKLAARLIRMKAYRLLTLLYNIKNRNRK